MNKVETPQAIQGPEVDAPAWSKLGFSTCSYLRTLRSPRTRIVSEAFATWAELLALPFHRRVFLDDRSPNCNAIRALDRSGCLSAFDDVHYCTFPHPPHSNFGIVLSYELTNTPYILHIDDDVMVTGTLRECRALIENSLRILETDPSILGINLLTLDRLRGSRGERDPQEAWKAGAPYAGLQESQFAHPKKLFGTCASLIRRDLLKIVGFEEVKRWGSDQPANWEALISEDPRAFLVTTASSPFFVPKAAWSETSMVRRTWGKQMRLRLRQLKTVRVIKRFTRS